MEYQSEPDTESFLDKFAQKVRDYAEKHRRFAKLGAIVLLLMPVVVAGITVKKEQSNVIATSVPTKQSSPSPSVESTINK